MFGFQNHVLKGVHQRMRLQDTQDHRSMIDSAVNQCDLWLYVLDMGQKKWLNCQGGGGLKAMIFLTVRKLDRPGVFVVKCLAKPTFWEVFDLNIRKHFSDSEGGWGHWVGAGHVLCPLSTVQSCGHMDYGGGNPKLMGDNRSKGCHQSWSPISLCCLDKLSKELKGTGRPSKPQPRLSGKQKLRMRRSYVKKDWGIKPSSSTARHQVLPEYVKSVDDGWKSHLSAS